MSSPAFRPSCPSCVPMPGRPVWGRAPAIRAALVVLALSVTGAAAADPQEEGARQPQARLVLDAVSRAWLAEDHAGLASRVAADGIDLQLGPAGTARNHCSASQAFYVFKNLFQATETDAFRFSLLREDPDTGLAHAVADWSYRRAGAEGATTERLFFTLARGEAGWGLTGIRAFR